MAVVSVGVPGEPYVPTGAESSLQVMKSHWGFEHRAHKDRAEFGEKDADSGLEGNETQASSQPREKDIRGRAMAQGKCPWEEKNMELSPWPSGMLAKKLAVHAGNVHTHGCVRHKSQRWWGWVGVEGFLV